MEQSKLLTQVQTAFGIPSDQPDPTPRDASVPDNTVGYPWPRKPLSKPGGAKSASGKSGHGRAHAGRGKGKHRKGGWL
jgi:hypothetical protein